MIIIITTNIILFIIYLLYYFILFLFIYCHDNYCYYYCYNYIFWRVRKNCEKVQSRNSTRTPSVCKVFVCARKNEENSARVTSRH